jgi:phosphoribosylanthranilate isomerase
MDVASLSPDYMGFIFYNKSPRFVGEDFLLPKDFPGSIKRAGVFVNEATDKIKRIASRLRLDFVQLHGDESPGQCDELKSAGIRIIKVFSIDESFDFTKTKSYQSSSDYFLFDTKGKYYGGNASPFDWSMLNRYDQKIPFFLSGGLSPDNIGQVAQLAEMNIHALDINSGVEISAGVKSIEKIKEVYTILNNNIKTPK